MGQKNILVKKFLGKKNVGQKDLEPIFFYLKKTQTGLIQGGGYITPPPPENGRVKILLRRF